MQSQLSIGYNSRVAAALNKLRHLLTAASHLSPPQFRLRVLLDPHDRVAVKYECNLPQALRVARGDGTTFSDYLHGIGVFH